MIPQYVYVDDKHKILLEIMFKIVGTRKKEQDDDDGENAHEHQY